MIDIEKLLAPCAVNPPCGLDLDRDPEFTALEQASQGRPERVLGAHVTPAEPPNWMDVKEKAEALFARTKDLRVAALYTRALTRLGDIEGLSDGLRLVHQLLVRHWEYVHPQLDVEDHNDPTMRLNALMAICDPEALLRDVRNAHIVNSTTNGKAVVRHLLTAVGRFPAGPGEQIPNFNQLQELIRKTTAENKAPLEAIRASVELVRDLSTYLTEKVGASLAPDLRPLADTLTHVLQACETATGTITPTLPDFAGDKREQYVADGAASILPSDIRSREEAVRTLDQVCAFLERTEPANPAPLLMRRAQRLMTKTFVEIIQDLAPDSLGQIQNIAGMKQD